MISVLFHVNPFFLFLGRYLISAVVTRPLPPLDPLNQSRSWSGAEMQERKQQEGVVKPHPPPRDLSADKHGRRRPKIRSGDKHRTPADAHLHEPTGELSYRT